MIYSLKRGPHYFVLKFLALPIWLSLAGDVIAVEPLDGLRLFREVSYDHSYSDTHPILHRYLIQRHLNYALRCDTVGHSINGESPILRLLNEGHCHLYGSERSDSKAYHCFLDAIELSERLSNPVLHCEALKYLIEYCHLRDVNLSEARVHIDNHRELAYDSLELLYNDYFVLRNEHQVDYHIWRQQWDDLIGVAKRMCFPYLETESRCVYMVQLMIHGQYDLAVEQYRRATSLAYSLSPLLGIDVETITLGNYGIMDVESGNFMAAIPRLRRALAINPSPVSANHVIMLRFLAQSHKNIINFDSAFFYMSMADSISQIVNETEKEIAVKEIETKYQNENLTRDLKEVQLQRRSNFLIFLMVSALLILLILFRAFRAKQRQNALRQQAELQAINAHLDGQEIERQTLSAHLHDSVVGHMVAASMHLKTAETTPSSEALAKSGQLIAQAVTQIRDLSHELYPPVLLKLGLGPAVLDLCEKYTNDQVRFDCHESTAEIRLKGGVASKLYYMIQELLNNVIKHSKATTCQVEMRTIVDDLIIRISDNGTGYFESQQTGLGLATVRSRIESMGGHLKSTSSSEGTTHTMRTPFSAKS